LAFQTVAAAAYTSQQSQNSYYHHLPPLPLQLLRLVLVLLLVYMSEKAAAAAAAAAEAFLLHCRVNSGVMRSEDCPVYRVCSVMLAATRREAQCSAVAEAQAASSTAASAAAVHMIEEPFAPPSPPRPKDLYLTEPCQSCDTMLSYLYH
jgi:hypothetical protein